MLFWAGLLALLLLAVFGLELLLLARTASPPPYPWRRPPSELGARFEEVTVPAADGAPLAAWYLPPQAARTGPGATAVRGAETPAARGAETTARGAPGVVVLHGLGAAKDDLSDLGALLALRGFAVLLPDLRGHGSTPGRSTLGPREAEDAAACARWLAARPEADPARLGAFGFSMGGAAAILAAARHGAPFRAIVADSAYASLEETMDLAVARIYRLPRVPFGRAARLGYRLLLGRSPGAGDVRAAVRDIPSVALLLIGGEQDLLDAAGNARLLAGAHPGTHEVWVIGGSRHGGTFAAPGYLERVAGFLRAHLA